jgi:hypothetical protein
VSCTLTLAGLSPGLAKPAAQAAKKQHMAKVKTRLTLVLTTGLPGIINHPYLKA